MSVRIINYPEKINSQKNENSIIAVPQETGDQDLDKAIQLAGYSYDPKQDIFISDMDPWQRNIGYCRLYDEAAAPLGMIIDCEPIHFEYQGEKWMIGLWKGQYDMVTGGEIGVYKEALVLNIPDIFSGTYYQAVSDDERLQMSYTLKKNGKTLFTREGKHWWLTGFKLGEFSEPPELAMDVTITLNNPEMHDLFTSSLKKAGYPENRISSRENTVSFTFDSPRTPQPITRTPVTDRIIQEKNKLLCDMYQDLTGKYTTVPEKVKALEEEAPELYAKILRMGKNKHLFGISDAVIMLGALLLRQVTKDQL